MISNPWRKGPGPDGVWIDPVDARRLDRVASRLGSEDPRCPNYKTSSGRPLVPGAWSGDPWTAPVVLLLLNPAVSPHSEGLYSDPKALRCVEAMARGDWDPAYPNAWLNPLVRPHEPWCSRVVCGGLHRLALSRGFSEEASWSLLSRRIAIIELSPWTSHRWSHHCVVSTTPTSVALATAAMADPNRIVLLGRGESDWTMAGLLDADTLPLSKGVRSNQCRITSSNFPEVWDDILRRIFS